ncbi:hypothetical protein ZIOFF_060653 [Zingiber officinale]|uniref:Sm domain-containing protein n=1 Tax=Zingiber officinale TaxID=94328 RepID=A0A8J5F6M7_ZINOF|nr:hypothetical protein ZIOFF_060653 [Zingiber officinale]
MLFFLYFKELVGKEVMVELKNDLAIRGILHPVDQYLNIKLENIKVVDEDKYPHMDRSRLRFTASFSLSAIAMEFWGFLFPNHAVFFYSPPRASPCNTTSPFAELYLLLCSPSHEHPRTPPESPLYRHLSTAGTYWRHPLLFFCPTPTLRPILPPLPPPTAE